MRNSNAHMNAPFSQLRSQFKSGQRQESAYHHLYELALLGTALLYVFLQA